MSNQKRVINPAADSDKPWQLSKNFNLSEFHCKDGTPVPEELVADLANFVENGPQKIRDFFGARTEVVSGYRHPAYNQRIQGAKRSYHQYGHIEGRDGMFACDLSVQGVAPVVVYQVVLGLMNLGVIPEGGVGLYKWGVHLDNRGFRVEF